MTCATSLKDPSELAKTYPLMTPYDGTVVAVTTTDMTMNVVVFDAGVAQLAGVGELLGEGDAKGDDVGVGDALGPGKA